MTKLHPRDEAAITNAMLLGELVTWVPPGLATTPSYAFFRHDEQHGPTHYSTVAHAAWMFLCKLGYGIEPNGTRLIKL